uniref:Uncharacterized protein n=1 Tax=Oryza punctata TaxID=4537 RepID=A0A0E0LGK7_ORYPU
MERVRTILTHRYPYPHEHSRLSRFLFSNPGLLLLALLATTLFHLNGQFMDKYSSDISPVYSLWSTFICLYIANYVVERSTGHYHHVGWVGGFYLGRGVILLYNFLMDGVFLALTKLFMVTLMSISTSLLQSYVNRSSSVENIALGNILKFPRKNWQFDVIGDSWADCVNSYFTEMWNVVYEILEHSYVSLAGVVTLLMIRFFFIPTEPCHRRRALLGFLHADAHLTSAVVLMLLAELAIEICICNNPLATSGHLPYPLRSGLYEWYRKPEREHFPDPTGASQSSGTMDL